MIEVQVTKVSKCYRTGGRSIQALDKVEFHIESHSFVAVVGYSGCGKTTLFRHIAGLEKPDSGTITFVDQNVQAKTARPRLGMMFQEPRLLPWFTIHENLMLALRRTQQDNPQQAVNDALKLVHMDDFALAYPDQLSGGMAQRVALARALCRTPNLLLMDEPFGALDALTRLQLQAELTHIWTKHPMTVLCITHDIGEAVSLADRILIMSEGCIVDDRPVTLSRPRCLGGFQFEAMRRDILNFILTNKEHTL